MTLEEKDKYIEDLLMLLSAETLRFMVADLASEVDTYNKSLVGNVIVPGEQYDKLVAENEELKQLEKQYATSLGRLARLSDVVCGWIKYGSSSCTIDECNFAVDEIMSYVESVRP